MPTSVPPPPGGPASAAEDGVEMGRERERQREGEGDWARLGGAGLSICWLGLRRGKARRGEARRAPPLLSVRVLGERPRSRCRVKAV